MTDKFAMTGLGYKEARIWLKQNQLEDRIENELSRDGYTITALANVLYAEKLKCVIDPIMSNVCRLGTKSCITVHYQQADK